MLEANTFPKDGAARGREYRNSQYTYRDRWTKVTARVLWNGLREQGSVLGYQNIRPNNGAKYVARWNLWYERKELSLPSPLLSLLPLSSSNAVEQNFSVSLPPSPSLSLSLFPSLVRNLGSLHATIVTSSSSTSINSSSLPPFSRSKREKSRCLSSVLLPGESIGRSTGTIFGIIHSVVWNYICKNVDDIAGGRMISLSREKFLYSSSRRGEEGGEREGYPHKDEILRCLSNLFSRICRNVVDSSIVVEILFLFFFFVDIENVNMKVKLEESNII